MNLNGSLRVAPQHIFYVSCFGSCVGVCRTAHAPLGRLLEHALFVALLRRCFYGVDITDPGIDSPHTRPCFPVAIGFVESHSFRARESAMCYPLRQGTVHVVSLA